MPLGAVAARATLILQAALWLLNGTHCNGPGTHTSTQQLRAVDYQSLGRFSNDLHRRACVAAALGPFPQRDRSVTVWGISGDVCVSMIGSRDGRAFPDGASRLPGLLIPFLIPASRPIKHRTKQRRPRRSAINRPGPYRHLSTVSTARRSAAAECATETLHAALVAAAAHRDVRATSAHAQPTRRREPHLCITGLHTPDSRSAMRASSRFRSGTPAGLAQPCESDAPSSRACCPQACEDIS